MDQQQRRGPSSPRPEKGFRSFSFRSDKSGGSSNRQNNIDGVGESPRAKERRDSIFKADSKANPNAALKEAQPGELNLLEKATIEPLRNFQHRDVKGNVITDPDLSNPTRPRMERPLDTIRSFEKAIDSQYKRRTLISRSESDNNQQYASRRSSYIGGGYDNGRQSQMGGGGGGGYYGAQGNGSQRQRYGPARMQSDSGYLRGNAAGVYPQHGYHPSHDTVGTSGSDSTGPWANSTDPSSENSSIERMNAPMKGYGQDGTHDAIMENGAYNQQGYGRADAQRRPIPLGNTGGAPPPPPPHKGLPVTPRPAAEKRKSWLSRRFSKKE